MARAKVTRLKETPGAVQPSARIIDADYAVVRRGRRTVIGRVKVALWAALCAALVGVMVPPLVAAAMALSRL